jgi:hypothetical protein
MLFLFPMNSLEGCPGEVTLHQMASHFPLASLPGVTQAERDRRLSG